MPFVTGTGLGGAAGGASSIIEALRAEIDSKMTGVKGTDWFERRFTGSIGGADREYWVEFPAAKTFHGRRLLLGFSQENADDLYLNTSFDTFAIASASDARDFRRFDGQPMAKTTAPFDDGSSTDSESPSCRLLQTGAAYTNHWIITSVGFGTDSPTTEVFLYFVTEVSPGRFLTFGFFELEQKGDWAADALDDTAGYGIAATHVSDWASTGLPLTAVHTDNNYLFWGDYFRNVSQSDRDNQSYADVMYVPHSQDAKYGTKFQPWVTLGSHQTAVEAPGAVAYSYSVEQLGRNHLNGVSVSTGIAQRLPVRIYMGDQGDISPTAVLPIGDVPGCFFLNISALNPGTIHTFGGEDFLVVPYLEKNQGSINTGNRGYIFQLT